MVRGYRVKFGVGKEAEDNVRRGDSRYEGDMWFHSCRRYCNGLSGTLECRNAKRRMGIGIT